jgi:hypothetical protein
MTDNQCRESRRSTGRKVKFPEDRKAVAFPGNLFHAHKKISLAEIAETSEI